MHRFIDHYRIKHQKEKERVFLSISRFLETVRMEHIKLKVSSDFKLQIGSICSVSIPSRNEDNR